MRSVVRYDLERQFSAELHHPGPRRGGGDVAEGGRFDVGVWIGEFGIVPNVESFRTEGEPHALFDLKGLEEGHVGVEQVRSTQDIAAGIAVREDSLRDVAGNGEGRFIDAAEEVSGAAPPGSIAVAAAPAVAN